jgi:solute carrier family 25 (mitochondrial phosphate transporter), member 23/24/25/41
LPYSAVRIYTYEALKRIFTGDVQEVPLLRKLAAGGIAGAFGCVFGSPGDILKIRMINDPAK